MRSARAGFRSATVLVAALLASALPAGAGAADLPPLPPLPEPLPSLLGGGAPREGASPSSASSAPAAGQRTAATSVAAELQRLVAVEINVVRRAHRRPRLALSTQLSRAGEEHARQLALAGFFGHEWSDGSPFGSWIRRYYPVGNARTFRAGENLAWSTQDLTAQQTVELWLASPSHRRILLDTRWREVGLGVIRADGAGGIYGGRRIVIFAAEFGLRRYRGGS